MPQPPSTNMLIVWPTDNDDADAWAPIMDTAIRQTIDQHNHSGGSGVKVPTAGLKIDADVSWAFGGAQFAITDLRAIDFSPQPASGMAALAGALFLNSADNELYYRTFGGSNVKLTSGAALNVAGFAGGIGGDYTAVSALVVFDDATDAYWFQQQIGAAVRQFAKMRCADLQLFEFKAVGATPVPVQAVTLKSPAALAAGYALTMPAALPSAGAGNSPLAVDSTGAVTVGGAQTIQIPLTFSNGVTDWNAAFSAGSLTSPVTIPNGSRITAVRLRFQDNATGPTKLTCGLRSQVDGAAPVTIATSAVSAGSGAKQTLAATGLTTVVASGTNYTVVATITTGAASCSAYWFEVDCDRP